VVGPGWETRQTWGGQTERGNQIWVVCGSCPRREAIYVHAVVSVELARPRGSGAASVSTNLKRDSVTHLFRLRFFLRRRRFCSWGKPASGQRILEGGFWRPAPRRK